MDEEEERVRILTAERDHCKEAPSVAEAELEEKARVAYREIDDQYNTANRKFERMSHHHLQHLVRK